MIDPKDNQDTSLIHRTTESKPPRNLSHYLIGRPLPTADAAHETILLGWRMRGRKTLVQGQHPLHQRHHLIVPRFIGGIL